MALNFAIGAGKRLSLDELVSISRPISDCIKVDDVALDRLDEIWRGLDEAKLTKASLPAVELLTLENGRASALPASLVRAGLVVRIMSLLSGKTIVRRSLVQILVDLVNHQITPLLSSAEAGAVELLAFLEGRGLAFKGPMEEIVSAAEALSSIGASPLSLCGNEASAVLGYPSLQIALACLVTSGAQQLIKALDSLSALSCEATGASIEVYDVSVYETHRQHRGVMQSVTNLRALFEGSKRVAAAVDKLDERFVPIHSIHQSTGPAQEVIAAAYKSLDIELNSSDVLSLDLSKAITHTSTQCEVFLRNVTNALGELAQASTLRLQALAALGSSPAPLCTVSNATFPPALAALQDLVVSLSSEVYLSLAVLEGMEKSLPSDTPKEQAEGGKGKPTVDDSHLTPEQRAKAEAKRKAKAEKAQAKAKEKEQRKGVKIGTGSASVRTALLSSLPEEYSVLDLVLLLSPSLLSPSSLLDTLSSLLESLHLGGKRKPKIAKGARDFTPEQMRIREQAFNTIRGIFKRHGGVEIDTPVFELKEVLMNKYGEDSKLIYDLADQGGELLSLRYDLTVPFARFLAMNSVGNIKRFHMAKVYRRDNPQLAKGRYREFYQCDFDIAGAYNLMVPDAEVICIATEILSSLPVGEFVIKLNHRKLLDGVFDICGVPASKFRSICSSVDKLDKMSWEEVKKEMVGEKGLAEDIADKIGTIVLYSGAPLELHAKLEALGLFSAHEEANKAMGELKVLFTYLEAMNALPYVSFDLSLARGLDYYTGVIYEAVLVQGLGEGAIQMGSIAAGGRYDTLVGMFSPSNTQTPCVGISIGVERVFTIMERRAEQLKLNQTSAVQVYIASIGEGLMTERMKIARLLWQSNVSAEYSHLDNPKFKRQLDEVLERGVAFMAVFGADELAEGVVKVKDMSRKEEVVVKREEVVGELLRRGCRAISMGDDSFIQAMRAAGAGGASSAVESSL